MLGKTRVGRCCKGKRLPDDNGCDGKGNGPDDIHPQDQFPAIHAVRHDACGDCKDEPRQAQGDGHQSHKQRIAGEEGSHPRPCNHCYAIRQISKS